MGIAMGMAAVSAVAPGAMSSVAQRVHPVRERAVDAPPAVEEIAPPHFIPVARRPHRLAGGFVVQDDNHVSWQPAVDVERVVLAGMVLSAAVGAAAVMDEPGVAMPSSAP